MKKEKPRIFLLQIEPTTRCNLRCVYCPREREIESGKIKEGEISKDLVAKILKKLEGQVGTVLYQGAGEPLLYRDLPELLDLAQEIGAKRVVITNGTLFRKEVFDRCDVLIVSIDSLRPDYKARKGSNSVKIKENILKIRENYPELSLILEPVVSKENINDLEEFTEFAREIKAKVKLLPQIGNALPPINDQDRKKIAELASKYPNVIEWSESEETDSFLEKKHPNLIKSLFVDIQGNVYSSYYETKVNLGKAEELEKIIKKKISE